MFKYLFIYTWIDLHIETETPIDMTTESEERPPDKDWDVFATGKAGAEVNDNPLVSSLVSQSRESNGVVSNDISPESVVEEHPTEVC